MLKRLVLPFMILLVCVLTGALCAKETKTAKPKTDARRAFWPQFHGPKRNNLSSETGLLKRWPEAGPDLLWTAKGIGHGFSTVSIARGHILTAGNIEGMTVVTAMDMKGKILWQTPNGRAWESPDPHPGTRGTPTIEGKRVYHESPHGQVICLDLETGKKIWTRNILEDFHSKNIKWGLAESVLIDGERLIVCPGGPEAAMVALDKTNGETIWKSGPSLPSKPSQPARAGNSKPEIVADLACYASPILVKRGGLRVILTLSLKAIIGVNADTGELLFRVAHESYADENVLTPLYRDGYVFISTIKAGAVKWKLVVKGDKASLSEVWRSRELDSHHDAVILTGGHLYGSSRIANQKLWVCLDWETGQKIYAEKGVGRGSVTFADGMLYTLSEEGAVGLVRADPAGHQVISQFSLPKHEGPEWERYWAHPVVCGAKLYLRHSDILYAFDVGE